MADYGRPLKQRRAPTNEQRLWGFALDYRDESDPKAFNRKIGKDRAARRELRVRLETMQEQAELENNINDDWENL